MRALLLGIGLFIAFSTFAETSRDYSKVNTDSLLSVWEKQPDDSLKVQFLNSLAWDLKNINQKTSFKTVHHSLLLAKELNFLPGIADASHTLGMLYWYQGNYLQASDFYFRALEIRERLNDQLGLARSYNNIGNVYFRQNKKEDALRYYQQALNIRQSIKDSTGLIYSYNNLGDVYKANQEVERALDHYEQAYEIAQALQSHQGLAFVSKNLGNFQLEQQAYRPAYDYFQQSLSYYRELNHKDGVVQSLNCLSKTLVLQKRNLEECISYSKEAVLLAKEIGAKKLLANAQINLAATYAAMGEYKTAYNLERKSRFLNMAIVDEARERAIVETQIRYDVEKQEGVMLQRENQLLQKQKELSRLYVFITLCFLIATLVIGGLIYTRLRTQAQTNSLLENKNKELQQSNQALERFAYVASHDLKEPLRSIGSFTTLLKRRYHKEFDREGQEYINYIVTGVNRMYHLLEDLLKYSRLIHQNEDRRENVDLNKIITHVKSSLDLSIKEKQVQFEVANLPTLVSNGSQMQQLFQNLLNNAIKYNDKYQPSIAIAYERKGQEHFFAVKDNGVGINKEYQHKIFDVFQRLSRDKYDGTGVGLAICKKIVEQHQGHIWVESEEGKGSTFYFSIPDMIN